MSEDIQKLIGTVLPPDSKGIRDAGHIAFRSLRAGNDRLSPGQAFKLAHGTEGDEHPTALPADYDEGNAVGIVDPYLFKQGRDAERRWALEEGELFLGFLFPGTATGLSHNYEHPAFKIKDTAPPALEDLKLLGEREAFLRAIAASPDDEAPHLIYSDWLEERGEVEEARKHRNWKKDRQDAWNWLHKFAERWNFDFQQMVNEARFANYSEGYAVARGIDLHRADELDPGDEEKFWQCLELVNGEEYDSEHRSRFGWSCSC